MLGDAKLESKARPTKRQERSRMLSAASRHAQGSNHCGEVPLPGPHASHRCQPKQCEQLLRTEIDGESSAAFALLIAKG